MLTIARVHGHVRYPARFQLVAAMNPCRCGYAYDPDRRCKCPYGDPERYVRRVSGPFLDRLDLQIEMARVLPRDLLAAQPAESSAVVRERIVAARDVALERNGGKANARLTSHALATIASLTKSANNVLAEIGALHHLSARSMHRLMRVARTMADLAGRVEVTAEDVQAAGAMRDPAHGADDQLAA
jgi:magnesium chelatase family protein